MKHETCYGLHSTIHVGEGNGRIRQLNVHGVTVLDCEGFGRLTTGDNAHYLDKEVEAGFAPKTKLEVVCRDEDVRGIVLAIRESAHTGQHGEGKIFVSPIEEVTDIHSGTSGEAVL